MYTPTTASTSELSEASLWKGKAKAQENDDHFSDINPTITYRHILAQNLGVRDPFRVIALCDSDAFYAACEMVRLGVDNDVPLVVLQWDSLIAVNYAARKFGISRMDKKKDALKRCPHLKVVHVATYKEGEKEPGYWDDVDTNTHKVSLDYYRRESMKIAALFRELLPGCEVEKASIDEAFIDFTKPVREVLLQRYPYLSQPPEDAADGLDTPLPPPPQLDWNGKGEVIPVNPASMAEPDDSSDGNGEPSSAVYKSSESRAEFTSWHDVALSIAADMMMRAREGVLTQLGYSTSAGLARNKFLAKLTASYRKPNGQSILRNAAIPNYLIPLPFQKIRFLGGKLGRALAEEYDAATVGDLLTISLEEMQRKFGEDCIWIYEFIRGIDRTEVKDKGSALNKSMLASKNLPKPITKPSEGYHWIRVLAAELSLRLNEARQMSPNLWPKSIVLHARKGYQSSKSKQAPFPFTREVTVDVIAAAGDKLWKELVGAATEMKVSNVQLSFTGIDVAEAGQQSIEGFFNTKPSSTKRQREEEIDSFDEATVNKLSDGRSRSPDNPNPAQPSSSTSSYVCPRCGKSLRLDPDILASTDDREQATALESLKLEHDDWHFAQDLSREDTRHTIKPTAPAPQKPTKAVKKRQKTASGIERFFERKAG